MDPRGILCPLQGGQIALLPAPDIGVTKKQLEQEAEGDKPAFIQVENRDHCKEMLPKGHADDVQPANSPLVMSFPYAQSPPASHSWYGFVAFSFN
ncbi:hypothetical protein E2562_011843 [Oryza meyeriana var. granulata]|uniref:Uncharacterized protein n=1 Tax=Oryza meyeriana var. granulata TaxID=110450 RepID=A0A6G1CPL3_9ORYZ|nr:hypothetical protein E2562_011843 [Oryza meyeriana var. granulata]